LIRRGITVLAILAGIGASAALASARSPLHAARTRTAQSNVATRTISKPVTSSGRYVVVVTVRARTRVEDVTVYLSGETKRRLRAHSSAATALQYDVTVSQMPTKLTVRAVSNGPAVDLAMKLERQGTTAGTTPTTPAPATPAPTPPPSNQYPDPYQSTTPIFDDEFAGAAGSAPSSAWTEDTGQGQCGSAVNSNTTSAANVSLNGQGQLAITALHSGSSYTSAQIEENGLPSGPYGAVEASIKLPPGQGLCAAFWLNGQSTSAAPCSWPGCGEIDILEAPSFGATPDYAIFTLHGPITPDTDGGNYQQFETDSTALGDLSAAFHTYGIVWTPNSIVWTIDGVAYASATPNSLVPGSTWPFNTSRPYSLILDLAVGGWPCDSTGNPVPPPSPCPGAAFPATMLVDWVHVYS
jgi:beta-glucanase (GH16 family)